ncbi:MAG: hypothetical protein ABTQ32_40025 [Myxococcaceae bacterium]
MKGLNVNGFIVVETLGSGRSGLLYLARHPTTGQEAIIRLASNGENELTGQVFLEEAASLLKDARDLTPTVASDGSRVLMAVAKLPDPHSARTQPLAPPERPRGEGFSEHAKTAQIARSPLVAPNRVSLIVLFVGLATLAAGVTVLALANRSAPTPVANAVPVPLVPAPMLAVEPIAPVPVPSAPAQPVTAPVAEVTPVKAVKAVPARPVRTCVADQRWRDMMMLNLDELEAKANAMDPVLVAREVIRIGQATMDAKTPEQCGRVVDDFEAVVKRAIK